VVGDMAPPPVPEPVEVAKADLRPVIMPPRPDPAPRALVQPKQQVKPAQQQVKQPQRNLTSPRPGTRPGSSRFDNAFGEGIPGGNPAGKGKSPPAQATGQQKSSWTSSINGKVLRPWNACPVSGLDAEKLRVKVRFNLAIDGSIETIDDVTVLPETITPANRAQVAPFKACAIRAIKLAAPFLGLPREFYNDWKLRVLILRKQ
jgi:periplasmic protein TonB